MREIEEKELVNVKGGGISPWLAAGLGAVLVFIVGIYDGQTRLKWQNGKNIELTGNLKEKLLIQIQRKD